MNLSGSFEQDSWSSRGCRQCGNKRDATDTAKAGEIREKTVIVGKLPVVGQTFLLL